MSGQYKRPGEGDHGGPAAKRPAYDEAPDFLDDEDDDVGEADDVFFDASLLDAGAARLADAAAGARPHWQRPRLPFLDPSADTVCACPRIAPTGAGLRAVHFPTNLLCALSSSPPPRAPCSPCPSTHPPTQTSSSWTWTTS